MYLLKSISLRVIVDSILSSIIIMAAQKITSMRQASRLVFILYKFSQHLVIQDSMVEILILRPLTLLLRETAARQQQRLPT
jgi:hypothetical protein